MSAVPARLRSHNEVIAMCAIFSTTSSALLPMMDPLHGAIGSRVSPPGPHMHSGRGLERDCSGSRGLAHRSQVE
jgi:hypothetical protein